MKLCHILCKVARTQENSIYSTAQMESDGLILTLIYYVIGANFLTL